MNTYTMTRTYYNNLLRSMKRHIKNPSKKDVIKYIDSLVNARGGISNIQIQN